MFHHSFDEITESALRRRQSLKWARYPSDVLPLWVAEMDYPLAEPVRQALQAAISHDDCGYANPGGLGDAFAPWAMAEWNWQVASRDVAVVCDVMTGIADILRVATKKGDAVVIEPPVYPPFAGILRQLDRTVYEAPLQHTAQGYAPDLDAIERGYVGGARAHLLCSPHNPTGMVYSRATLERIAELADTYGVLVLSDEVHAPLTLPGASYTPFASVSAAAARCCIALTSASKTWNVAGLKAAMLIATADETRAVVAKLPPETPYHAGHLGIVAGRAAFTHGAEWRTSTHRILSRNRALLGELLRHHLPTVRWTPPHAGYLAWLDCRELGLGPDPSVAFLARGKVALSEGPTFGREGEGFARLNMATTRRILEEAVRRLAGIGS